MPRQSRAVCLALCVFLAVERPAAQSVDARQVIDLGWRIESIILANGPAATLRAMDEALAAMTALSSIAQLAPYKMKLAALRAGFERDVATKSGKSNLSDDLDALAADMMETLGKVRPEFEWYFNVGIGCGAVAGAASTDASFIDVAISAQYGQKQNARELSDAHLTRTLGMMNDFVKDAPSSVPGDWQKALRDVSALAKKPGVAYADRERQAIARRAEEIAVLRPRSAPPSPNRAGRLADLERLATLSASPAQRAEMNALQTRMYSGTPPPALSAAQTQGASIAARRAGEALTAGRLAEALKEAVTALNAEPDDPNLYAAVGLAYLEQKDFARARVYLREAIWRQPDQSYVQFATGYATLFDGEAPASADEAVPFFDKAVALNAKLESAYVGRAWAQLARGKYAEAAADAQRFLDLTKAPQDALLGTWTGEYLCSQGRTRVELAFFRESSGAVIGRFSFSPPGGGAGPSGAYLTTVKVNGPSVVLVPSKWERQPDGFHMVGATMQLQNDMLMGTISNPACGAIAVQRKQ